MNLSQLYQQRLSLNHNQSDKGTGHDYINSYYTHKFDLFKHRNINFLEIGVYFGFSISLWREFFTNAVIYGIDSNTSSFEKYNTLPNIKLYGLDGYCPSTLNTFEDGFFDFIIDDGPHTLESQIYAAKEWSKKLNVGGALIIEDIPDQNWISLIQKAAPSNFESNVYDFRKNKNRHDDVIIEFVRKS